MTSYDTVWTVFLNNCKTEDISVPTTEDKIYDCLNNALLHFNNRLRTTLTGDNSTELFSEELDGDSLLILAHYIRLILLKNELTYYTTVSQPFLKEIGMKNYKDQVNSFQYLINDCKSTIDELILNTEEDFL
ncbi:hypothetical protein BEH_07240 [Priestia filamentosa]|uniref:Uncharacterized protein n=1 Tax=Priestia filamentosa TaxID=1402861 RepID=A0A0H4KUD8_9BACI|nr:hypothetical protein [Priestia filamentosa]AKO91913.1 hypothetical protein BEH_07240 [Priestia filamentosa]